MTTPQLIPQLKVTMGKQSVQALARNLIAAEFPVKKVIDLCFHKDQQTAFHAAWVVEQIYCMRIDLFLEQFGYFTEKFPQVTNPSVKRHFSKLIALLLQQTSNKEIIAFIEKDSEKVAETLFEWLIDPAILPGVKVWCIDGLAVLAGRHQWIRDELLPTVEAQLPEASAGLRVRSRKLLRTSL